MGHPQPPTPVITDNSTTAGFTNGNIQIKKSKSWDMNLHWLRDRENHNQFKVVWQKGSGNGADYHTKHHPTVHHKVMRPKYIRDVLSLLTSNLRQIF